MSIEDHEFQDEDVLSARPGGATIDIKLKEGFIDIAGDPYIQFDRDDIIALAKAIELTGEDLK